MVNSQTRAEVEEHNGSGLAPVATAPARSGWTAYLLRLVLLIAIVIGGIFGYKYWRYSLVHVSTDDAELSNDVIQIAPQVSGTIQLVTVQDNDFVKKGQLLVQLDDATYRASVAQAKANLDAAIAQAQGAGVSINLTTETGDAQLTQAQGLVAQAASSIAGSHADVAKANMAVIQVQAAAKGAEATVANMEAGLDAARTGKQHAISAFTSAQAQVENARAAVRAQQAGVTAAQANEEKAARDEERYQALLAQDAISQQTVDQATAAATAAKAQVEVARQQVLAAQAQVDAKQADANAAQQQVSAADSTIAQATAMLNAAKEQFSAARASIGQAKAQRDSTQDSVNLAEAHYTQAIGQLHQAHTTPRAIAMSKSNQAQAKAKVAQAKAALDNAKLQLSYTRIYAPADGQTSKKSAEVGALVQSGTPLLAIVPQQRVWVVANYKETQLAEMKEGQRAEISVDAFPAHIFTGKVDSINAATGATFSLLPPDNATGNFTKVVQRIPVKIVLDADQPDLERLRAGMSVTAVIATR